MDAAEIYGYTPQPIDPDRGISLRQCRDGKRVIMYKSMPGLYLNPAGQVVKDAEAEAAGFDVVRDRREAQIRFKIEQSTANIRRQQAEMEQVLRRELDEETRSRMPAIPTLQAPVATASGVAPVDAEIVTERTDEGAARGTADFVIKHRGGGRWDVWDRGTGTAIAEKLLEAEAIEYMVEAQVERNAD